jgi:hypothetical protein
VAAHVRRTHRMAWVEPLANLRTIAAAMMGFAKSSTRPTLAAVAATFSSSVAAARGDIMAIKLPIGRAEVLS